MSVMFFKHFCLIYNYSKLYMYKLERSITLFIIQNINSLKKNLIRIYYFILKMSHYTKLNKSFF